MKKNKNSLAFMLVLSVFAFYACSKNETLEYKSPKTYISAAKGKYIIYKLDSIVTRTFGTAFQTASYTIKDSVVDVFTDNTGRESFKIFRYHLNPANNTWTSTNTFVLTPQENSVEFIENNLRYIKLVGPVTEGKEWKGNNFINQPPYYQNATFGSWTYRYKDIGKGATIGTQNFANTLTVVQYDSLENRVFNPKVYNFYDKGYEIYAEGVGLVYKDVMSWEYQVFTTISNCKLIKPKATGTGNDTLFVDCNLPATNCDSLMQRPNHKIICDTTIDRFYYNGYGIKQSIISHN